MIFVNACFNLRRKYNSEREVLFHIHFIDEGKEMNKRNYQRELEHIIEKLDGESAPSLFLHSCCAPCSSYVLEYLKSYFQITVFYYNPNISCQEEYQRRVEEQKRLIGSYNQQKDGYSIQIVEGDYQPELFFQETRGLEKCPEGGERCFICYRLRLEETARQASIGSYDYFATTLTISPLKNAEKLNEIGELLANEYQIPWLPSDFKKKNGYKRSIELSKQYELYRQDYCGCVFSSTRGNKNLL